MILQMRNASYSGKVASHNLKAATAAEVFAAATISGAHSVGRTDIGRLEPRAKADIVIIDLTGRDTLRMRPVRVAPHADRGAFKRQLMPEKLLAAEVLIIRVFEPLLAQLLIDEVEWCA
jgi:cytosine/adenosine deaminase-related metal-dependent hydrolase